MARSMQFWYLDVRSLTHATSLQLGGSVRLLSCIDIGFSYLLGLSLLSCLLKRCIKRQPYTKILNNLAPVLIYHLRIKTVI